MLARFAGATLGLLAFCITAVAGLCVNNPVAVTLSRSILALFVFCIIGLALGAAVELVVREYERTREEQIRRRYRTESDELDDAGPGNKSTEAGAAPIGT
jgi:hypothetical protein